jgi:hypothetical protein
MGELMLERGFFTNDPFSFTRPDQPILLTEWGSRVLYALVHGVAGLTGVALFGGLLIGTACALLVLFLKRRGADPLLAYLSAMVAAVLTQAHWLARPHLFSLVGCALLLFLLEPGGRRHIWWYAALFAAWANLHGGFVLGLVLIATCLAGALLEAWSDGDRRAYWLDRARWYAAGLVVATLASFVNPQGPLLLVHIAELLGNTALTSTTSEFMSPNFHALWSRLFIVAVAGIMVVLALVPRRPAMPRLLVLLLMFAGALIARRNISLFGIIAVPLVALHADAAWRAIAWPRLQRMRGVVESGESVARPGLWLPVPLAAVVVLAVVRGSIAGTELVPNRFDPAVFPVEAVAAAREAGIEGRILNSFTWGGYIVYAWPEQKIFIDGMTDYFGSDIHGDYVKLTQLDAGWQETLERWSIDRVLLPPDARLVHQLRREPGWTTWHEDETAVLLVRDPG